MLGKREEKRQRKETSLHASSSSLTPPESALKSAMCAWAWRSSLFLCVHTHTRVCVAGSCISGMEMEEEIRPGNGEEGGGGGERAAWRHATKKGRTKHLRAPCVCMHAVLRQEKRKCANPLLEGKNENCNACCYKYTLARGV